MLSLRWSDAARRARRVRPSVQYVSGPRPAHTPGRTIRYLLLPLGTIALGDGSSMSKKHEFPPAGALPGAFDEIRDAGDGVRAARALSIIIMVAETRAPGRECRNLPPPGDSARDLPVASMRNKIRLSGQASVPVAVYTWGDPEFDAAAVGRVGIVFSDRPGAVLPPR